MPVKGSTTDRFHEIERAADCMQQYCNCGISCYYSVQRADGTGISKPIEGLIFLVPRKAVSGKGDNYRIYLPIQWQTCDKRLALGWGWWK